jgi:hypothetical protein
VTATAIWAPSVVGARSPLGWSTAPAACAGGDEDRKSAAATNAPAAKRTVVVNRPRTSQAAYRMFGFEEKARSRIADDVD